MRFSSYLTAVTAAVLISPTVAIPVGEPKLSSPREPTSLQLHAEAVPPPSGCETEDNLTPWGTVETCGKPPVPKGHPSLTIPKEATSPKGPSDYVTIITEADVTWCRPFPNTVIPALGSQFFKWTALNLTCWTNTDPAILPNGKATRDALDLWVKTGDQGCYINENDLRAHDVNFPQYLRKCRLNNGPHPLEPNPGSLPKLNPSLTQPVAIGTASPVSSPKSVEPASIPKAAEAVPIQKPNVVPPTANSTPTRPTASPTVVSLTAAISLVPSAASPQIAPLPTGPELGRDAPRPATVLTVGIEISVSGLSINTVASIPQGPQVDRATPRPDATALNIGVSKAGASIASIPQGPQPERTTSRPDATALGINTVKPEFNLASIPRNPQPDRATPRPDATALAIGSASPRPTPAVSLQNIPAVVAKTVSGPWATPSAFLPDADYRTVSDARNTPTIVTAEDPAMRDVDSVW